MYYRFHFYTFTLHQLAYIRGTLHCINWYQRDATTTLHQLVVGPHYAALVGIKERSSLIMAGRGAHGREHDVVDDVSH